MNTGSRATMVTGGVVVASLLVACAGADVDSPQSSASGAPAGVVAGVVAIGHSGLTGENADPARQGIEARDQSWATGDSPEVDSIYARMVAQDASHEGHVANTAQAGAAASELRSQARAALDDVPAPALVIVQSIDNDIRCDGTDAEHVEDLGEGVRAALELVTTASPLTKVLVVSQRGRPSMIARFFPVAPDGPAPGEESCNFVDEAGQFVTANADYLTSIIESYEAEQARVCSEFAACSDDGGVMASFEDTEDDLAGGDGNHLTTKGQARTAALMWPVVAEMLGY